MEAVVALAGLALGVAAHDLAAQGLDAEETLRPFRGTCPRCLHTRGWAKLVCPECGRRVRREFLVSILGAGGAVGVANTVGYGWHLVPYAVFLILSTALLLTDIDDMRIVDRLNIRGTSVFAITLTAVALALGQTQELVRALLGGAAYFAGSLALYTAVKGRGFGGGDVKLSVQLGMATAFLSWGTLGWSVFATAVIGGLMAVFMVVFGSAGRNTELPYGPAMILGAWLAIILAGMGAFPLPS